jgi:hypothetical protein
MSTKQDDSFDPSQRRLCPDGSCVGLLGSDGRCKTCGTLDPAGNRAEPTADPPASPTPQPESRGEPAGFAGGGPSREGLGNLPGFPNRNKAEPEPATASDAEAAFDPTRRLCPDDACIGVIGSDNKCSVCGRRG